MQMLRIRVFLSDTRAVLEVIDEFGAKQVIVERRAIRRRTSLAKEQVASSPTIASDNNQGLRRAKEEPRFHRECFTCGKQGRKKE